jgi:UDP-glucose 4-epimerase
MTAPLTLAGTSCLVLGAGGFIGGHLCHALIRAGARVHGFGRRPKFPDALPTMRWTTGEFSDRAALAVAVDGSEIVFHLLGGTNPEVSNKDPLADLQVNTVASVQLLELCRAAGVLKVVFVSSGGTVYGIPEVVPTPETAPTDPISAYGINKLMVEKYLHLYHHLHGLRAIGLRVSNPFGPYQSPYRRQGVVAALIETYLNRRPVELWGDGRVVRDFVYISDLAEAIVRAASYDGPHRIMNIGSGIGRSLLEVVKSIGIALDMPEAMVVHKPGRRADVPSNVLDTSLARNELNWEPRTEWITGLQLTADWIRATYPSL